MPNDPKLIEAIAQIIADELQCPADVAQSVIAALKAEGWMLVRWERDDPMDRNIVGADFVSSPWAHKDGKAYKLTGLEPPAAGLAGRPDA